jgi:prephenate dehydrogenase
MKTPSVCILGPGLLGGSLLLALRERQPTAALSVWARREDSLNLIRERKLADYAGTDLKSAVAAADIVVLCVPVGAMAKLALEMKPWLQPETVVTDVGSVKGLVMQQLEPVLGAQFVGAHPMAGSEQTGMEASRADLYEGARCMITPGVDYAEAVCEKIEALWRSVGCRTARLSPQDHDEIVAWISHLPHFLAAALVAAVGEGNSQALEFCGPGFRDTSRVAAGPEAMWTEILLSNREPLKRSLHAMIEKLQEAETLLAHPAALEAFLADARKRREELNPKI